MKLLQELVLLTEAKVKFSAHEMEHNDDSLMVLVMLNADDDSSYNEDYYGVNVVFNDDGTVETVHADAQAAAEDKAHHDEIINVARNAAKKELRDRPKHVVANALDLAMNAVDMEHSLSKSLKKILPRLKKADVMGGVLTAVKSVHDRGTADQKVALADADRKSVV